MSSQLSTARTIPYELSQNQDEHFVEELNTVNDLYFQDKHDITEHLVDSDISSDSDESVHLESDENSDSDNTSSCNVAEEIVIERSVYDSNEHEKQEKFKNETCGCREFYSGTPCSKHIDIDSVIACRGYCQELTREEHDIAVKTALLGHRHAGGKTCSKKHQEKDRCRPTQKYYFMGARICRTTFCFLYNVSRQKLQVLGQSLDCDGLKPRVHGLVNKLPHNSLTFDDRQNIKMFLQHYAYDNAVPLPGRLPNFKNAQVMLLPSDKSKTDIHEIYEKSVAEMDYRSVCLKTFKRMWKELCPHIVLSKPQTDLCDKCQQYASKLAKSGTLNEDEKSLLLSCYEAHITSVKLERDTYRQQCAESKDSYLRSPLTEGSLPCSQETVSHYSWDYAQQVHFPHHSQQTGPLFFKKPRKCNVFGVCCEATGKQVFYLANEGDAPGKGANSVISSVHHYLQNYGLGEEHGQFHFDNCVGQNKNNFVLWYAMWRIIVGLHTIIDFGTMVAGHTKFAPDWHFGLWKMKWRNSDAETVEEVAETVRCSSRSGHNIPHLVAADEHPVTFYDWKTYLARFFKPLKGISRYHHFHFSADNPGEVSCRISANSVPEKHNLLKCPGAVTSLGKDQLPDVWKSKGLDLIRQWYLFDEIRSFCRKANSKDVTCPKPVIPKTEIKKRKWEDEAC